MSSQIQKFSVYGVDLRGMKIYFDSASNPVEDDLYYDVIIGPFSQKVTLSKRKSKKDKEPKLGKNIQEENQKLVAAPIMDERPKNSAAVELGRLGGLKGGPARAEKLSAEKRKEIAQKAAQKRWSKE